MSTSTTRSKRSFKSTTTKRRSARLATAAGAAATDAVSCVHDHRSNVILPTMEAIHVYGLKHHLSAEDAQSEIIKLTRTQIRDLNEYAQWISTLFLETPQTRTQHIQQVRGGDGCGLHGKSFRGDSTRDCWKILEDNDVVPNWLERIYEENDDVKTWSEADKMRVKRAAHEYLGLGYL